MNDQKAETTRRPVCFTRQVGGDHYASMAIQPAEFIVANGIPWIEGQVIKYIARHESKNGAEDIEKAIHYCEMLLEMFYGKTPRNTSPSPTEQTCDTKS